ncbi:hypothetical protein, variant [Aphanomyces invadans]|uniref:EF-hand domain-containing protein n=1 Tax=Aphanomyces invadans TaxID=157072 RepID=A0A024UQ35_9STRA|nr:hypothetical protein, variant [Aphanomyces invadans]ETW08315.1 hypothetical protein, variant [Aphanomyces invadans]|eukprot:XP_008862120.1 hypothetical protein, variant [Aphanomyces invadans]
MEAALRSLFEHLDRNRDGNLCVDDLSKAVRGLPLMTAWQLIAEMDKFGDGYVPLTEFLAGMPHLVAEEPATSDPFSWTGIWRTFKGLGQDVDVVSPSTPSVMTTKRSATPPQPAPVEKKANNGSVNSKSQPSSRSHLGPDAHQPSLQNVVFRPTSQATTMAPSVPQAEPLPSFQPIRRRTSSKLDEFLKQVPSNAEKIRPIAQDSIASARPLDSLPNTEHHGQSSNEEPFESPKTMPQDDHALSDTTAPDNVEFDPGMDLFGQPSAAIRVSDESWPRAESTSAMIVQSHGIPSEDSQPPATSCTEYSVPAYADGAATKVVECRTSGNFKSDMVTTDVFIESGDDIHTIKHEIAQCVDAIKRSCAMYSATDAANAREVLTALAKAKAMMAVRPIPQFLGAAVKSFDKSSLSTVADNDKTYNFVSIYHVEQAMKIRAFRKTVLLHVYPTLPDNPKQVLADLFPDIVADTIDQMFEACANDLNSCFEVLSGLSDYSTLESSLSPKAPYLRRIASTKQSIAGQNDLNDDDLNAPIFDVKGYKKPRKPDKALVSVVSDGGATSLDGKYLSIPQTLDEESFVDAWPQMPPTLAIDAFSQFESAQNMPEILGAWKTFNVNRSTVRPNLVYSHLKRHLQPVLSFRQLRVFEILDRKRSESRLYAEAAARSRQVVIVGGGPVGLRTAIEVALLGGEAIVVEKRSNFNREQILHLFPWVVHDLTKLGAKMFYPQFCMSSSHLHIGTRQLQCILLKVALLLGVTVFDNTSFESIAATSEGYVVHTVPPLPHECEQVSAVVGAGGHRDPLSPFMGITRKAFSPSPAVGAVVTIPNLRTKLDPWLRSLW